MEHYEQYVDIEESRYLCNEEKHNIYLLSDLISTNIKSKNNSFTITDSNGNIKVIDISMMAIIKDAILNYRPLNKEQLEHVKLMNHDEKNTIIDLFNEMTKTIETLI